MEDPSCFPPTSDLQLPRPRPGALPRPALEARLSAGMARRLTTVIAPGGYGKTTLLAQWASRAEHPVAWLTVSEGGGDLGPLFTTLAASIEAIAPNTGSGALGLLRSPAPPSPSRLARLLSEGLGRISGDLALILDDAHLIADAQAQRALSELVASAPPGIHFYLGGRSLPLLGLDRRRARHEWEALTAADLRFDLAEAARFLSECMGLAIEPPRVEALQRQTEGWVAGLQLAALADRQADLASRPPGGLTGPFARDARSWDPRFIFSYLASEILDQQPDSVRDFLLETSILEDLSPGLCDAVTGREGSAELLAHLEAAGLFTFALAGAGRRYRYHALFKSFLQERLEEDASGAAAALEGRAARWLQRHGDLEGAVTHGLRAADGAWVAEIIEARVDTLWTHREMVLLRRWLDALDEALLRAHPKLMIYHAWAWLMLGLVGAVEARLREAEAVIAQDPARWGDLSGVLATVEATLRVQEGSPAALSCYRRADGALPPGAMNWRGAVHLGMGIAALQIGGDPAEAARWLRRSMESNLAVGNPFAVHYSAYYLILALLDLGRLGDGAAVAQRSRELLADAPPSSPLAAWPLLGDAEIHLARGDSAQAAHALLSAIEIGRLHEDREVIVRGDLGLAAALLSSDPGADVAPLLSDARSWAWRMGIPDLREALAQAQAALSLAAGDPATARAWMAASGLADVDQPDRGVHARLLATRVLLAEGRPGDALARAGALDEAIPAEHQGLRLQLDALIAAAQVAAGREDLARDALARALPAIAAEDHRRPLLQLMGPLRAALEPLAHGGPLARAARDLLSHAAAPRPPERARDKALIEPLGAGELGLLRLVAQGLSNDEIASRRSLSINTVKWHLKNVYGKLGVRNRTAAVARARQLGLL